MAGVSILVLCTCKELKLLWAKANRDFGGIVAYLGLQRRTGAPHGPSRRTLPLTANLHIRMDHLGIWLGCRLPQVLNECTQLPGNSVPRVGLQMDPAWARCLCRIFSNGQVGGWVGNRGTPGTATALVPIPVYPLFPQAGPGLGRPHWGGWWWGIDCSWGRAGPAPYTVTV